jgi:glycerophosphoryl diester phosphodiesterase
MPAVTNRSFGVQIAGPHGPVRLKWHRLRRTAGDADFTTARLREGLGLGASMEVDLRRHAEHGFVCLHDAVLESETDGEGTIAGSTVAGLRRLKMRLPGGAIGTQPLLLLEDIVAAFAHAPHKDAVLQFDLKERIDDLDETALSRFADLVQPIVGNLVLSGDDWAAVRALGSRVHGLKLGYDPSDLPAANGLETADDFAGFARFIAKQAPEAGIIYLEYHLILRAIGVGFDLVGALHTAGKAIDAWTFDLGQRGSSAELATLIGDGIDQLSSNDCIAIEAAAAQLDDRK